MIRQSIIYTLSLFLIASSAIAQKPITLNDIWASGVFYPKMISGFINLNDGKSYVKMEKDADGNSQVVRYLYSTGEKTGVLIDGSKIATANGMQYFAFGSFTFNADETKALIPVNTQSIYRHSSKSNYLIWDKATNKLSKVSEEKVRYATFNPQSTKVAYVFNNDLYVKDLAKNKTKRLTKDGEHNSIINGAVDWVYEEEFGMSDVGMNGTPTVLRSLITSSMKVTLRNGISKFTETCTQITPNSNIQKPEKPTLS